MAWNEYKNSYQSIGRLMYCLSDSGVPVRVVEDLIFHQNGVITYGNSEPFATYHWVENKPVVRFAIKYVCYQETFDSHMRFIS